MRRQDFGAAMAFATGSKCYRATHRFRPQIGPPNNLLKRNEVAPGWWHAPCSASHSAVVTEIGRAHV